jgi:hypothetical protein
MFKDEKRMFLDFKIMDRISGHVFSNLSLHCAGVIP